MDDDELEQRIRAAKPGSSSRHMPLTPRAEADLARILAGTLEPTSPAPRRRRLPIYVAVAASVLAIVSVVVVAVVAIPRPAWAVTPPVLSTQPTTQSALEALQPMLDELSRSVDASSEVTQTIRVQTWALTTTDSGDLPTVVAPENLTIVREADGARQLTATAGAPYGADGKPAAGSGSPEPGTLLWEQSYAPAEYAYQFPSPPPTTPAALDTYLHEFAALPPGALADAYLTAVPQLLMEWDLTPGQEYALLSILAGLPDLEVLGAATDRLGRPGVAFQGPVVAGYRQLIVVSSETGRIISFETMYVGHDRTDIPSPAVVAYYAWERNPR